MSSPQNPTTPSKTSLFIPGSIAALLTSSGLSGQIVTNTDLGVSGGIAGNSNGDFFWNIDNSGLAEIGVRSVTNFVNLSPDNNGFAVRATGSTSQADLINLATGATVNSGMFAASIYSIHSYNVFKNATGFPDGGRGHIGFQFNPSGSLVLYGWAEVILTPGAGDSGTFEIVQWAYESSGGGITVRAGAVPEPASAASGLGLLALGAAGLRRSRWLKRAKQTS